jgi:hypothetical protein
MTCGETRRTARGLVRATTCGTLTVRPCTKTTTRSFFFSGEDDTRRWFGMLMKTINFAVLVGGTS